MHYTDDAIRIHNEHPTNRSLPDGHTRKTIPNPRKTCPTTVSSLLVRGMNAPSYIVKRYRQTATHMADHRTS